MLYCASVNAVYGEESAEQSVEGGQLSLRIATELLGTDGLSAELPGNVAV